MRKRLLLIFMALVAALSSAPGASAFSFDLDSIAAMGRFPNFCIRTYRWGDKFFNGYDTAYVAGTGYKFNVKSKTNSWIENNTFRFADNHYQMNMTSYPSTSTGIWLTYMAVSAGYDVNVSQLLNLTHSSRKRWSMQFNCMLFGADMYLMSTNSRMRINRFGHTGQMQHADVPFDDINGKEWGLDTYYFFNHKHYSQSAAFYYSRIQKRSSGSLFAGFSVRGESYLFDFSSLPDYITADIPDSWPNSAYRIHAHSYTLNVGYGYNWALSSRCVIGVSEAPSLGVRYGYINDPADKHVTFCGINHFKASFVWNNDHWFAGVVGKLDTNLFSEKDHALVCNQFSFEASVGYRFNLW